MDEFMQYTILFSSVSNWSSALLISYRASMAKADEIADDTEWYDPELSRRANKFRMKQVGSARFSYLRFIKEMTIIGIAKSIEDLIFDLREVAEVKFDFWNPGLSLRFHEDMKCVRNLNNVIKHSRSVIVDDDHPANRALIDECGFAPNSEVEWIDLNLEELIAKAFVFQVDVISQVTGTEFPDKLSAEVEEVLDLVNDFLMPEVLQD